MAIIVESTSCTGKTVLGQRPDCLDLDSNRYKFYWDEHFAMPPKERPKLKEGEQTQNPDWWNNYLNEIIKQSPNFKIIAVGISSAVYENEKEFKKWLEQNNLKYIVAVPEIDDMEEWILKMDKRRKERGSSEKGRAWVIERQAYWIECMKKMNFPKITIKKDEFLENALVREEFIERRKNENTRTETV